MANHKTKLELTWIGKENRPKLEPRILVEDPEKSYHAPHRVTTHDLFDNRLIFGDHLLALKALEQEFTGKIKETRIGSSLHFDNRADLGVDVQAALERGGVATFRATDLAAVAHWLRSARAGCCDEADLLS